MLESLDGCFKQVSLYTKGCGELLQDCEKGGNGVQFLSSLRKPHAHFCLREEGIKCDPHIPVGGLCLFRETFLLSFL